MLYIFIFFHLIAGFLAYGIAFAYFHAYFSDYPDLQEKQYRENMWDSIVFGLVFGVIGLLVVLFLTGFAEHGFKIK